MSRSVVPCVLLASMSGVVLTSCMPKMTIEDMKAAMPERSPELEKLNAFVGRWEVTGEAKMAGLDQTLGLSGRNEAAWEGGGGYLVAHGINNLEGLGEFQGMAAWTYDTRAKKYRGVTASSTGVGIGIAWYDEETRTWHMRNTGYGSSGKTRWKGRVRFIDDDTKEEHWTGYTMGGLVKMMELRKTERRR